MHSLVIYESMYGNTHHVADAVGRGLAEVGGDVVVVPVERATPEALAGIDLLVVGGPTHAHAMSREGTRKARRRSPESDEQIEVLRAWLARGS